MLNASKINRAIERLERNLPLRHNQLRLPPNLRKLHQDILRHYLQHGTSPKVKVLSSAFDLRQLADANIIVLDETGEITGAYPFVNKARGFSVATHHGSVNAMCAFDALAISSMFDISTRIESRCRLSDVEIVIEQNDDDIRVVEPQDQVFAAINWGAAAGAASCSATLCFEMVFIVGEDRAKAWQREDSDREVFSLGEAHAFISAVFVPLMG